MARRAAVFGLACAALALLAACREEGPRPVAAGPEVPPGLPPFVQAPLDAEGRLVATLSDRHAYPLRARGIVGSQAFANFLAAPQPRSLAMAGHETNWAWRWGSAAATALTGCERAAGMPCRVYATGDRVVWQPHPFEMVPADVIPPPQPWADTFTYAGMLTGATATEAGCRTRPDSLWAAAPGGGECIRVFAGRLAPDGGNPVVVVYLQGDQVYPFVAEGRVTGVGIAPDIVDALAEGPASLAARRAAVVAERARTLGVPWIVLSRPGTYGSSGNQWRDKGTEREAAVVDAALDALRARHGIGAFVLAGFSGGGTLAANLLPRRDDVACAVLASASLAQRADKRQRGFPPAYADRLLDPMETLAALRPVPGRRIFTLTDEQDRVVPARHQLPWAEAARAAGHEVHALTWNGRARDARRHALAQEAMHVAARCAAGMPTGEILRRARAGDFPPLMAAPGLAGS